MKKILAVFLAACVALNGQVPVTLQKQPVNGSSPGRLTDPAKVFIVPATGNISADPGGVIIGTTLSGLPALAGHAGQAVGTDGTSFIFFSPAGTGTVLSVGLAMPNIFTVTNSPVTSTGTLTAALASQAANLVLASPNGSSGVPSFRALAAADIPSLLSIYAPATTGNAILYANGSGGFSSVTIGSNLTFIAGTLAATGGSGSGTVMSFSAGALSPLFTTSVATATTTPALSFSLSNAAANLVFAGPTTGAPAAPSYRSLVVADIPTLTSLYATAAQGTKADNVGAVNGIVKSNGSASFSAAVSGTDYAPATSGASILYANGSGGFSSVTIGGNLSFSAGTLSATAGTGTVTQVTVTTANGVSASVANQGTTPALTFTLGAITPTTVNGLTISATTGTFTLTNAKTFSVTDNVTLSSDGTGTRTLNVGAGGTLGTAAFTAASAYATAAQGTKADNAGAVNGILKSNGLASFSAAVSGTDYAPATSGSAILSGNGSGGFSSVTVGANLTFSGGTLSANTNGSVTSVAQTFTGGLISVAGSPITTSGTLALTVAGTSGGVPYFSSSSAWSSSAVLASGNIVTGGGAGGAPTTITTGSGVTALLGLTVDSAGGAVSGNGTGTLANKTISATTFNGIMTYNGTSVLTAKPMAALAIDVTNGWNSKTISGNTTFTFSGTPAASIQTFGVFVKNSDVSNAFTITVPTSYSMTRQNNTVTIPIVASGKLYLTYAYDSSDTTYYLMSGDSAATVGTGSIVLDTGATITNAILVNATGGTFASANLTNAVGLPIGGLATTGTPSGSNFLRGDFVWATPAGAGNVTGGSLTTNAVVVGTGSNGITVLASLGNSGAPLLSGGSGLPAFGALNLAGGSNIVTGATPVANGGTGLTAGTSGGIPYYSSTSAITSSALLGSGNLMTGGGAGAAPATITTGAGITTALGLAPIGSGNIILGNQAVSTTSTPQFARIGLNVAPLANVPLYLNQTASGSSSFGVLLTPSFDHTITQARVIDMSSTVGTDSAATVTNFYTLKLSQPTLQNSSTISNLYQLYIGNPTSGISTNYSIFADGVVFFGSVHTDDGGGGERTVTDSAGKVLPAAIASGALISGMTATTQSAGSNNTTLSTTAYSDNAARATHLGTFASPDTTAGAITWTSPVLDIFTSASGATRTYTLGAASSFTGQAFVLYVVAGTNHVNVKPASGAQLVFNGTLLTANHYVQAATSAAGNFICFRSDGTNWASLGSSGTWADAASP